jgi:hypothetical protein
VEKQGEAFVSFTYSMTLLMVTFRDIVWLVIQVDDTIEIGTVHIAFSKLFRFDIFTYAEKKDSRDGQ